jgi:hypothetical protein
VLLPALEAPAAQGLHGSSRARTTTTRSTAPTAIGSGSRPTQALRLLQVFAVGCPSRDSGLLFTTGSLCSVMASCRRFVGGKAGSVSWRASAAPCSAKVRRTLHNRPTEWSSTEKHTRCPYCRRYGDCCADGTCVRELPDANRVPRLASPWSGPGLDGLLPGLHQPGRRSDGGRL